MKMLKAFHRLFKYRTTKPINIYRVDSSVGTASKPNAYDLMHRRFRSDEVAKAKLAKLSQGTIFDKIISKEIPADIIFEDDKCLAFNDVSPQAPVHFLVIPKRRLAMLDSCTDGDAEILSHLLLTAKKLAQQKLPEGYRLVINNGVHGAQSVFHLHVHILGGRQMSWPPG